MTSDRIKTFFKDKIGGTIIKNAKIIWSSIFAIIFFIISRYSYFIDNEIFGYNYFGETLVGAGIFILCYLYGKFAIDSIGRWIERLVGNIFRTVLYDFWVNQSAKLAESLRRQMRDGSEKSELENDDENYFYECPPIVLDTSAIIDARILGVIKCGFLDNYFIITQSVIDELKSMADKANKNKKEKGRRGLDVLNEIKKAVGKRRYKIIDTKLDPKSEGGVDKSLLDFCVKHKAKIATLDFNLNKAAQASNIPVLNVNKLANEIKINLTPGDVVLLKLLQEGKEIGQSVGYLEDGTMIVVRESIQYIGHHKEVVIEKVIQTDAGRMVFAYLNPVVVPEK